MSGGTNYVGTFPSYPVAIKVEYGTSTAEVFVNGTTVGTWNSDYQYIGFKTYRNRSMTVKNVKITTGDTPTPASCTEYISQIENAITYINGSGS